MGARRIVIDAIDVLLRLYENPSRERRELHLLQIALAAAGEFQRQLAPYRVGGQLVVVAG